MSAVVVRAMPDGVLAGERELPFAFSLPLFGTRQPASGPRTPLPRLPPPSGRTDGRSGGSSGSFGRSTCGSGGRRTLDYPEAGRACPPADRTLCRRACGGKRTTSAPRRSLVGCSADARLPQRGVQGHAPYLWHKRVQEEACRHGRPSVCIVWVTSSRRFSELLVARSRRRIQASRGRRPERRPRCISSSTIRRLVACRGRSSVRCRCRPSIGSSGCYFPRSAGFVALVVVT